MAAERERGKGTGKAKMERAGREDNTREAIAVGGRTRQGSPKPSH